MIKIFTDIEEFNKSVSSSKFDIKVGELINLDFAFFESHDKYALISVPDYSENPENMVLMSKNYCYVLSSKNFNNYEKYFKNVLKKPYGESTVITLVLLRNILKNYSQQFERIRSQMNFLDINPDLEKIESSGRDLRRLTDRFEELVRLIITLKEREVKEFDTTLITFEYDLLNAEARYWLERCRSHVYRIASLRTKSEMQSNRELNATMKRLTVIMTFLTIVGIIVSVPGTIGAIFGIPALSDKYFQPHTSTLIFVLVLATLLTIILGYLYWKSLKLK